jgi:hypothetical protein
MPRELPNFTCSHIPMEIFLFYERGKKQGNQKRELFMLWEDLPIFVCSPEIWEHPWVPLPQENTLEQEPPPPQQ